MFLQNVELGFNPTSKQYVTFMKIIDPAIAAYILKYHNNDNRKMKRGQIIAISNSIRKDGWLQDGGALTFNVEGNITEFQHRLQAIIETGVTVEVPVVLGVSTDCFTKTAAPKPRTPGDEVQRKDSSATSDQITTLRELVTRRKSNPKFNMNSAVAHWKEWKKYIKGSEKLVTPFFTRVNEYSTYRRTFAAWASLLHFYGRDDIVTNFLNLLEDGVLRGNTKKVRLVSDMNAIMKESWKLSPADRTSMMYKVLCLCADKMDKEPSGEIELGSDISKITHDNMKHRGFYRKFLENASNIPYPSTPDVEFNTLPV